MAVIEFKNLETETAFKNSLIKKQPKQPVTFPAKIAYQKFVNGSPVLTIITRE